MQKLQLSLSFISRLVPLALALVSLASLALALTLALAVSLPPCHYLAILSHSGSSW